MVLDHQQAERQPRRNEGRTDALYTLHADEKCIRLSAKKREFDGCVTLLLLIILKILKTLLHTLLYTVSKGFADFFLFIKLGIELKLLV